MAQKSWTLTLPEGQHTVELETGNWTWRTTVRLDGQPVPTPRVWFFDPHRVIPVPVAGHDVAIHIRSNGFTYNYDLVVDGRSLTTGLALVSPPPTPPWAWIFAGACGILLFLGGACGGALGLAGLFGCLVLARDTSRPVALRVALCAGITVIVWGVTLVVAGGLSVLLHG